MRAAGEPPRAQRAPRPRQAVVWSLKLCFPWPRSTASWLLLTLQNRRHSAESLKLCASETHVSPGRARAGVQPSTDRAARKASEGRLASRDPSDTFVSARLRRSPENQNVTDNYITGQSPRNVMERGSRILGPKSSRPSRTDSHALLNSSPRTWPRDKRWRDRTVTIKEDYISSIF